MLPRGPSTPSYSDEVPAATELSAAAAARIHRFRIGRMSSYKLLDGIGNGAYGVVRRARHRRTGEDVAIKYARAGGDALLQEAGFLAACKGNPAVVGLRGLARSSNADELRLVMEFAGTNNLHDVVSERCRRGRPFTELETRRMMSQLLAGAVTMHAQGVIHCDLKPGNVVVGEDDGQLKICDFGLAKSMAVPPQADTLLQGTLRYMAPEQLLGEKNYGAPVDMWSLGCVMAELITGNPLFQQEHHPFDQAISIIRLLGIPDDVSRLPLHVTMSCQLRDIVPEEQLSHAGFDVLCGLLEFDPKDRLTAAAALQMPWFVEKDEDAPSPSGL